LILIDEVLIESPVAEAYFACDLDACKGACCWEGDYGAPLDADEVEAYQLSSLPYQNRTTASIWLHPIAL